MLPQKLSPYSLKFVNIVVSALYLLCRYLYFLLMIAFSCSQIVVEEFLEDINNILNSGEVLSSCKVSFFGKFL